MDASGESALIPLVAFIGAVIGFIGWLAGALHDDPCLSLIAQVGTLTCGYVWARNLDVGS